MDLKAEYAMGIDEAGRGPVLGPMVYACCVWPINSPYEESLKVFRDSKALTAEEREKLYTQLEELQAKNVLTFYVKVLSAELLSNKMLQARPTSLNTISHECAMELVQSVLSKGYKLTHVYIDTVGIPAAYKQKLNSRFYDVTPRINFTVEPKADASYPIVSAASIAAKVTRDRFIENWAQSLPEKAEGEPQKTGSGYPSDPYTQKWLKNNIDYLFGYPSIVRFSWETCKTNLEDNKAVKVTWDGDNGDEQQSTLKIYATDNKQGKPKYYYAKSMSISYAPNF